MPTTTSSTFGQGPSRDFETVAQMLAAVRPPTDYDKAYVKETNAFYDYDAAAAEWVMVGGAGGGGVAQVPADWAATSGVARILNKPTIPAPYTLPTATATALGGVKVGTGLAIDSATGLLSNPQGWIIGEEKTTFLPPEKMPLGWILEDGREKTTLTTTQQAALEYVFGASVTAVPNAADTYATQSGAAIGAVTGSNSKAIGRNQLPNINLDWRHDHYAVNSSWADFRVDGWGNRNYSFGAGGANQGNNPFSWDGGWINARANSGGTSIDGSQWYLNGGVTQQEFDVRGKRRETRFYIYLGP